MVTQRPEPHPVDTEMLLPDAQARNFLRVRDAHRREIVEDYVEMISELGRTQGDVRTGHLAERFGVSNATVSNHVQRLVSEGMILELPYQPLVLTDAGRNLAETSRRRHVLVRDFLISLGVDAETAEADAEGIEHHVSEQSLAAFAKFIE
ncbi:metal dependent repressor [Octadecabacter antarcticus 307]|uniref:Transcriptional regulator MntR n=2 Tax=Octadecabacter TaxID=53945 RepID=M9R5M4_9RHOB|nr:metal dependent repressor [Octadecabacter antarcticus 307]